MTATIAQGIYDTRLNGKWRLSQPSVVPAGRELMNQVNQGTTSDQHNSLQRLQDAQEFPNQGFLSGKQTSSPNQDDGQYHPNRQSSSDKQIFSDTRSPEGAKAQSSEVQEVSFAQQASPQTPHDGQNGPTLASSSNEQGPSHTQDDGQYHPDQESAEFQRHMTEQFASTQHGTAKNVEGSQYYPSGQSNWNKVAQAGQDLNSAADTTQPPVPTHPHPVTTASQTASTISLPTSTSLNPNSSASSTAAHAGIALSVICAMGFIAILVFLPLYKKRKRLQQTLGSDTKELDMHDPPKSSIRCLSEFLSNFYLHGSRVMSSMSSLMRPKRRISEHATISVGTQHGSAITNDAIDFRKSPRIEVCSAPEHSPTASMASWVTEKSTSCANSLVEQLEDQQRGQLEHSNSGHVYSLGSQVNLSVGNVLAVNPLTNDIYTVEIDFNPSRVGQLELRVGQRLVILQSFDNGWVCVPGNIEK